MERVDMGFEEGGNGSMRKRRKMALAEIVRGHMRRGGLTMRSGVEGLNEETMKNVSRDRVLSD